MAEGYQDVHDMNYARGYIQWSDKTLTNGSWATNVGANSSGYTPKGDVADGSYNLALDIPGKYLVTFHAKFNVNNTTGLRGLRVYISEANETEYFVAPTANGTTITVSCIIDSNGGDTIRMGLYQSSGETVTCTDLFATAIKIH